MDFTNKNEVLDTIKYVDYVFNTLSIRVMQTVCPMWIFMLWSIQGKTWWSCVHIYMHHMYEDGVTVNRNLKMSLPFPSNCNFHRMVLGLHVTLPNQMLGAPTCNVIWPKDQIHPQS